MLKNLNALGLGNSVFALKAVYTNTVVKVEKRTPDEVIKSIEAQERIVSNLLKSLQKLFKS